MPVYMAECKNKKPLRELEPKEKEKLRNRGWRKIATIKEMIRRTRVGKRRKRIFCGVTLASLNLVFLKLEKDDRDGLKLIS